MGKQRIKLSKGCPYNCSFCFNGKVDFEVLDVFLPEPESNNAEILDDAFLSIPQIVEVIKNLGCVKYRGKIINYELIQGINILDLTPEIAFALKEARFKNIRFAWDTSYTKKNMYKVYDAIQWLVEAGYKRKELTCYILSNYHISLRECLFKAYLLLQQNVQICNCKYRKNYLDPKIYPEHWNLKEIEYFTQICRHFSQLVRGNGWDSEINTRLIRAKQMPLELLSNVPK